MPTTLHIKLRRKTTVESNERGTESLAGTKLNKETEYCAYRLQAAAAAVEITTLSASALRAIEQYYLGYYTPRVKSTSLPSNRRYPNQRPSTELNGPRSEWNKPSVFINFRRRVKLRSCALARLAV